MLAQLQHYTVNANQTTSLIVIYVLGNRMACVSYTPLSSAPLVAKLRCAAHARMQMLW